MKAAFLDRDGVLNTRPPEGEYVTSWAEFELIEGTEEAIKLLNAGGYLVIVVTNQRCVARGLISEVQLKAIHSRLLVHLRRRGARLDGVYYCPHNAGACGCRKPGVGLFELAKKDFPAISFADSVVIGDSITDIEAGLKLGCTTILIADGARSRNVRGVSGVASTLYEAVQNLIAPMSPKNEGE